MISTHDSSGQICEADQDIELQLKLYWIKCSTLPFFYQLDIRNNISANKIAIPIKLCCNSIYMLSSNFMNSLTGLKKNFHYKKEEKYP